MFDTASPISPRVHSNKRQNNNQTVLARLLGSLVPPSVHLHFFLSKLLKTHTHTHKKKTLLTRDAQVDRWAGRVLSRHVVHRLHVVASCVGRRGCQDDQLIVQSDWSAEIHTQQLSYKTLKTAFFPLRNNQTFLLLSFRLRAAVFTEREEFGGWIVSIPEDRQETLRTIIRQERGLERA